MCALGLSHVINQEAVSVNIPFNKS
jgi:hypothetical protein